MQLLTSLVRPCKRCVGRGIAHLCRDADYPKRMGARRKSQYLDESKPISRARKTESEEIDIPDPLASPRELCFVYL